LLHWIGCDWKLLVRKALTIKKAVWGGSTNRSVQKKSSTGLDPIKLFSASIEAMLKFQPNSKSVK